MNNYGFNQKRYKHEQGMKVAPCDDQMEMDLSSVLNPPSSVSENPERYGRVT